MLFQEPCMFIQEFPELRVVDREPGGEVGLGVDDSGWAVVGAFQAFAVQVCDGGWDIVGDTEAGCDFGLATTSGARSRARFGR